MRRTATLKNALDRAPPLKAQRLRQNEVLGLKQVPAGSGIPAPRERDMPDTRPAPRPYNPIDIGLIPDPLPGERAVAVAIQPPLPRIRRVLINTETVVRWLFYAFLARVTKKEVWQERSATGLRALLESLGGLWVSLGHLLARQSTRYSAIFCEELRGTNYRPVELSASQLSSLIEQELGKTPAQLFTWFDPTPKFRQPFAQLYRARVRSRRREVDVLVRVLMPGTAGMLEKQLGAIRKLAQFLRALGLLEPKYVQDILMELDAVRLELSDYRYEAAQLRQLRKRLREDKVHIPWVFHHLCGRTVLTTEYIAAPSIAELALARSQDPLAVRDWMHRNGIFPREVANRLLRTYLRQVCEEPLFDRNLAPEHVLVLRNGELALVGSRSMRALNRNFASFYSTMLRSIVAARYDKAADCFLLLCDRLPLVDITSVKVEFIRIFRAYVARAELRPADFEEKSLLKLFNQITMVAGRHGINPSWQLFDVHHGWMHLDACLSVLIREENLLKQVKRYFESVPRRQLKLLREVGLRSALGAGLSRVSELVGFYSADLRKRAREFQGIVSKGAYLFATVLRVVQWGLVFGAIGAVLVYLHHYHVEYVDHFNDGMITDVADKVGQGTRVNWMLAILGISVGVVFVTRLIKVLLEPEYPEEGA